MVRKEHWKPIKEWEELYEVSDIGNVKRLERSYTDSLGRNITLPEKILSVHFNNKTRYQRVNLSANGKTTTRDVHRLVAEAFIPNPDNLPEVNHKDENHLNNQADNLEWVTHIQNEHHGTKIERAARTRDRRPVEALNEKGEVVASYDRIADAAKALGISISTIWQVCNKIRNCKTAGGYRWRYIE